MFSGSVSALVPGVGTSAASPHAALKSAFPSCSFHRAVAELASLAGGLLRLQLCTEIGVEKDGRRCRETQSPSIILTSRQA